MNGHRKESPKAVDPEVPEEDPQNPATPDAPEVPGSTTHPTRSPEYST